jgi:hypothetical protein
LRSPAERLFSAVSPVRSYNWEQSFKFNWFECLSQTRQACYDLYIKPGAEFDYVNNVILWDAADKQWGMTWTGKYLPYPNASSIRSLVSSLHAQNKSALAYFSAWFHGSRNATEYVGHVAEFARRFALNGMYTDGLPEDNWIAAYEEMRMLRALFGPTGTIIVHDTLQEVGGAPAEYRPFIHAYATTTLMGEGEKSNAGTNWSWARYCASQFRKSNAFGSIKGTGWTGPGISAPNSVGNQDLVQLVLGGRERPGLPGYSERYLPALRELEAVWRAHGDPNGKSSKGVDAFYDQYYLPAVLNLTNVELGHYGVGRSPMPIASLMPLSGADSGQAHKHVQLVIFRSDVSNEDTMRYTTDGTEVTYQSTVYTGIPIEVATGAVVRARNYRGAGGMPPSRELRLQVKSDDMFDVARIKTDDGAFDMNATMSAAGLRKPGGQGCF